MKTNQYVPQIRISKPVGTLLASDLISSQFGNFFYKNLPDHSSNIKRQGNFF